jgi:hypothetical protein
MNKRFLVLGGLFLTAFCFTAPAQQQEDVKTDFTGPAETLLIEKGDYVLRGTVLVQYRGDEDDVVIPGDWGITEVAEAAFINNGIKTVVFPEGITKIDAASFIDCYNLRSVRLPKSLSTLGDGAFSQYKSLAAITVAEDNAQYADRDGILFSKDLAVLLQYPAGKNASAYTIPDSVKIIGNGAFSRCSALTSVVISNSVTTIGDYAFYGCSGLTSVSAGEWAAAIIGRLAGEGEAKKLSAAVLLKQAAL